MNYFLKIALFIFVTSSIISCKNQSKVGLEVLPHGLNTTTYYKEYDVDMTTVQLDSVVTGGSPVLYVGDYTDPEIGKISCKTLTHVTNQNLGATFPHPVTLDSLCLTFKYANIKYGDTTKPFTLNVYRLTEKIDSATSYISRSTLNYNPTPIGTITFNPSNLKNQFFDSVTVRLDDAFGNEIISKVGTTAFSTKHNFEEYFKGLMFSSDGNASAIISGSLKSDTTFFRQSRLVLNYHYTDSTKAYRAHFPISSSTKKFIQISNDRSGTALSGLVNIKDSLSTSITKKAYVQPGSGLAVKLTLPNLKKHFGDTLIAVNRAELVLPSTGITYGYNNAAPLLMMYQATTSGEILLSSGSSLPVLADGYGYVTTSSSKLNIFGFDNTKKYYSAIVTDYLQAIQYNKVSQYYILTGYTKNPGTFIIGDKTSNTPVKLRVYYTKIQ